MNINPGSKGNIITPRICYTKSKTLILLDFDDTLYPSSYIAKHDINNKYINIDYQIWKIYCNKSYQLLLKLIKKYGSHNIYIVTNASKKWVNHCLNQLRHSCFMNISHLISQYKISIISAKDTFGKKYPSDSVLWKSLTFKYLIKRHYNEYNKHFKDNNGKFIIVCIGDGLSEYYASNYVINQLNHNMINRKSIFILHRIKLLEKPTIKQLIEEYSLILLLSTIFDKEKIKGMNIDYNQEMNRYHHHHHNHSSLINKKRNIEKRNLSKQEEQKPNDCLFQTFDKQY